MRVQYKWIRGFLRKWFKTNLDVYKEKILDRRQSRKAQRGGLTGRHDLQPIGTIGNLKKRTYSSKERVSISGNVEV